MGKGRFRPFASSRPGSPVRPESQRGLYCGLDPAYRPAAVWRCARFSRGCGCMRNGMHRRCFIALLGGALAVPRTLRAEQKAMPVIGFLGVPSPGPYEPYVIAFREGLSE